MLEAGSSVVWILVHYYSDIYGSVTAQLVSWPCEALWMLIIFRSGVVVTKQEAWFPAWSAMKLPFLFMNSVNGKLRCRMRHHLSVRHLNCSIPRIHQHLIPLMPRPEHLSHISHLHHLKALSCVRYHLFPLRIPLSGSVFGWGATERR